MSVASILGADGKIAASFGGGAAASAVTNPLTADLDCGGFELQQASYVRTNVVELETLEPKAPQTFVECVGDFSVAPTKAVDTDRLRVDVMEGRTGSLITALNSLDISGGYVGAPDIRVREGANYGDITYSALFNEIKVRPADSAVGGSLSIQQGGGAQPKLGFVNVASGNNGNLFLVGANNIASDSVLTMLGRPINFVSGPNVAIIDYNAGTNAVTARPATSGVGGSFDVVTAGGALPSLNLTNSATGNTATMVATATRLELNKNLDLTSADGRVALKEIDVKASAAGKLIFPTVGLGGLTVNNGLPTLGTDKYITLTIGGVDYQLALKTAP